MTFPTLASGAVSNWWDKGVGVVQSSGNFTSWTDQKASNVISVSTGTPTWDSVNQQVICTSAVLTTQSLTLAQGFWIAWGGYASGYVSGDTSGVVYFGDGATATWTVQNQHGTSLGDIFFTGDLTFANFWEGTFAFSGTTIKRQIFVFNGTSSAQSYQNGFAIAKANGDGQTGTHGPSASSVLMATNGQSNSSFADTTVSYQRIAFGTVTSTSLSAGDIALIDNWLVTGQATLGGGSGAMLLMGCGA